MANILLKLVRRFRPTEGWTPVLLALAVVICVQQAAASARLGLPASVVGWSGVLGVLVGRVVAGQSAVGSRQSAVGSRRQKVEVGRSPIPIPHPPSPIPQLPTPNSLFAATRIVLMLLIGLCFWTLLVGRALPPPSLVWRDGVTLLAAARQRIATRSTPPPVTPTPTDTAQPPVPVQPEQPVVLTWDSIAFLNESLPRFWGELRAAPNAGETGAALIASETSVLLTWIGALVLGVGLCWQRNLLGWGIPLLVALATTKLLGGGAGVWLFFGLGLLLLLALLTSLFKREQYWAAQQIDYAGDVGLDVAGWGIGVLALVLPLAAGLPFALDNPVAQILWAQFEPPSALQALERQIDREQRPPAAPVARPAGSTLPEVALGVSLEQGPNDQVALRMHTGQPLPPGPWPHYWRSRVLNIYTGDSWRSNALITPQPALDVPANAQLGLITQEVEDARPGRRLVYGLPEMIGISIATNGERLSDGTLAASTFPETEDAGLSRYRVFSRPSEQLPLAPPEEAGQAKPDLSTYLLVPGNMPLRVRDLARTLTRDAKTPMESALALESYLRKLPYSYEVAPLPEGGDAVDQFLFSMRQGYCTYYASSFALLARTLGIPARVNIGYYTGSYDATSGSYIVYERDAHAWPELYIQDRWLPFEPTPIRPLPARSTEPTEPSAPPLPAPILAPSLAERAWTYAPGIGVVLVLVLAMLAPLLPRYLRRARSPQEIQRQLERRGARAGVPWPAGATLHEYGVLLGPHLHGAAQPLETLVNLIEESHYSGHSLTPDQQGRLLMAWNAVRRKTKAVEAKTKDERRKTKAWFVIPSNS